MANPKTVDECFIALAPGDNTLKDWKSTPARTAYCFGGTGVINVYFFDHSGEIAASAQTINITTEVGVMGLPGIVFPMEPQTGQGVAESNLPRTLWMEIIAVSGTLTWGLYGATQDATGSLVGAGTWLKSGTHRSYTFKVGSSLRIGPAPAPHLGVNGAIEVDEDAGSVVNIGLSTETNRGGTITLGGTAQNAMAANSLRQGGYIYNPYSATESLFVSENGAATSGSPELKPGGFWQIQSTNAISVLAATTGHAFDGGER